MKVEFHIPSETLCEALKEYESSFEGINASLDELMLTLLLVLQKFEKEKGGS